MGILHIYYAMRGPNFENLGVECKVHQEHVTYFLTILFVNT